MFHLKAVYSTENLEMAVHAFQACCLLEGLLGLCSLEKNSPPVWPWAARLTDSGLQLELNQARPVALEMVSSLLNHSPHFQASSAVVDLLQDHGHLCFAYHTAMQVAVLDNTHYISLSLSPAIRLYSASCLPPLPLLLSSLL